ncbi:unnamed protein product [Caenorhabditis brenneri]
MLKILISISVLLGTVSPLRCYSCDDETPCSAPFPIDCLQNSTCYTVMENEKVIVKGCARSCDHVPKYSNSSTCQSCHQRDFCNGPEQGIGHNVHREHHRNVNGSVEITNDTVVNVRTYVVQAVKLPTKEQPCSFWSRLFFMCSSASKTSPLHPIAVPLILYMVL